MANFGKMKIKREIKSIFYFEFGKLMKNLIIILILIWGTAFQTFSAKTDTGNELKAVLEIAEKAETQFAEKNYIESLSLYRIAYDQLLRLMQNGIILFHDGNKYLKKWQEKQKELEPHVREITYSRLFGKYNRKRKDFEVATQSNNVYNMSILLSDCDKIYRVLEKMKAGGEVSEKAPDPESLTGLRNSYQKILNKTRRKWIRNSDFTDSDRKIIYKIINTDSLEFQNEILDEAAKKSNGITLAELEKIYFNLAMQQPTVYKFWHGLGNSCILQGKRAEANQVWHRALEFFPDSIYVHYHLARTCSNTENGNKRAASHLKWILSNTKERNWLIKAHLQLAVRYLQLSELKLALTHSRESGQLAGMNITPETRKLYSKSKKIQCSIQLRIGNTDGAISSLEDAVQMSPENISLKLELADLLSSLTITQAGTDMKKAREALLIYDKIIKENPKKAKLHSSKAKLFLALNNFPEAEKEAILELTVKPQSPEALTFLGLSYLGQGKKDAAKIMFNKALDIDPTNAVAQENLNKLKR